MKGLLSKIEYIVIGIFALIFFFWAFSKCSSQKQKAMDQAAVEAREDSIALAKQNPQPAKAQPSPLAQTTSPATTPADSTAPAATGSTAAAVTTTTRPSQAAAPEKAAEQPKEPQYSKLFVTIDKLKLRKTPGLKAEVLGELKLFDEVYYMNQVTDSLFEVNLGKEVAKEPYVKIKTKRGTVGWVYGAGVHYVKKKRSGVLE